MYCSWLLRRGNIWRMVHRQEKWMYRGWLLRRGKYIRSMVYGQEKWMYRVWLCVEVNI